MEACVCVCVHAHVCVCVWGGVAARKQQNITLSPDQAGQG